MADEYLDSIEPWRKLLPLHFSTWPEIPGDTRSDSHAWTAHPIYDLLTLVAGIALIAGVAALVANGKTIPTRAAKNLNADV